VTGAVLLYDGTCGICNGTVQFIMRNDRRGSLHFAALESPFGLAMRRRHPELATVDSVVWIDTTDGPERVLIRSDAALRVTSYLGIPWSWAAIARVIPRAWRDAAYDAFARRRYGWFGRAVSCPIPTAEQRRRFLDADPLAS
jgi:predicted DCC family thiol-disulfide oxidoreductase YuxK